MQTLDLIIGAQMHKLVKYVGGWVDGLRNIKEITRDGATKVHKWVHMKRHDVLLIMKKKLRGTFIAIALSGVQCILRTRNFVLQGVIANMKSPMAQDVVNLVICYFEVAWHSKQCE